MDIFGLEDNLPDELVSSGNNWGEQLGGNKPPAQGPGPGGMPLNGEDPGVPNVQLQRQMAQQHQQQIQHLMQQVSVATFFLFKRIGRIIQKNCRRKNLDFKCLLFFVVWFLCFSSFTFFIFI